MSKYLKPCPFCGSEARLMQWGSSNIIYIIRCSNPDCPVPIVRNPAGSDLDEVINEWNRRQGG